MKDTFYFSHDYNANNDEKILALRSELGMEGYGVYWYLIEKLASNGGYLSLDKIKGFAYDLHIDNTVITRVITQFDLFITDEKNRFFNKRIIEHLQQINDKKIKKSEAGKKGMNSRWQSGIKKDNNVITKDNNVITKDNKLNNIKLNNIKLNNNKKNNINIIKKNSEEKLINTTKVVTLQELIKNEFTKEFLEDIYKTYNLGKDRFISSCEDFTNYWTEKNPNGKKEKWQMQKTFDIKLRFRTWIKRNSEFKNKSSQNKSYEVYSF